MITIITTSETTARRLRRNRCHDCWTNVRDSTRRPSCTPDVAILGAWSDAGPVVTPRSASAMVDLLPLVVADPRVEESVGDVGEQVGEYRDDRDEERRSHHDRVVSPRHRVQ